MYHTVRPHFNCRTEIKGFLTGIVNVAVGIGDIAIQVQLIIVVLYQVDLSVGDVHVKIKSISDIVPGD